MSDGTARWAWFASGDEEDADNPKSQSIRGRRHRRFQIGNFRSSGGPGEVQPWGGVSGNACVEQETFGGCGHLGMCRGLSIGGRNTEIANFKLEISHRDTPFGDQ